MITAKHILSALKQLGFLVLALLAFTLFINLSWFDEELHPQLQRLKVPQPVALEGNAYPLVWGLQAVGDKDPFAVGKAIIQRQRELHEQGEKIEITPQEFNNIFGAEEVNKGWQEQYASLACNTRLALDCADKLIADVKEKNLNNPQLNGQLQIALQRFDQILRQPFFKENQEGDMFAALPSYSLLMNVSKINLAIKSQSVEPNEIALALDKDYKFWLRMLKDGEYLIAKMVALAGIRNNMQMGSYFIRANTFNESDLNNLQAIYRPLTEEERNIGETFVAEMRINLLSWQSQELLYGDPSWLQRLFLQENATLNDTYMKVLMPVQVQASLQPHEFYQRGGFQKPPFTIRIFPPDLYNLGGKLAVKKTYGSYNVQDYVTRVNDTVGQINTLKLQIELALKKDQPIEVTIERSQYRNPFTLEPLQYRAQDNSIGYDCLSPGQTDVCRVRL